MVTVSNTGELSSSSSRYNEVRLPLDDTKNHVTAATEVVEAEDKFIYPTGVSSITLGIS